MFSCSADAIAIWKAGLAAVRGDRLIVDAIRFEPAQSSERQATDLEHSASRQLRQERLCVNNIAISLAGVKRVFVFGAGKASAAMAQGLEQAFGEQRLAQYQVSGQVNVPDDQATGLLDPPLLTIKAVGVREPAKNFPTERAWLATEQMIVQLQTLESNDLAIALISGGGSAALTMPVDGVSVAEKSQLAQVLSAAGANIEELNIVRQQISQVKGGGLASQCRAKILTLVISDVINDNLSMVASGPTIVSQATPKQALDILEKYDAEQKVPTSIYHYLGLRTGQEASCGTTENEGSVVVVGSNASTIQPAMKLAKTLGYSCVAIEEPLVGDANQAAVQLAEQLGSLTEQAAKTGRRQCLLARGETTVRLCKNPGKGGRNQQMVLSALQYLMKMSLKTSPQLEFCLLCAGTDGEDGSSPFAGAWIHQGSVADSSQRDLITHCLERNDAQTFFECLGTLLDTGPTHTNVCDLYVLVAVPPTK